MFRDTNKSNKTRQRLFAAFNPHLPTNEERAQAWQNRLRRHNKAQLNGRSVSFPLPVTKA